MTTVAPTETADRNPQGLDTASNEPGWSPVATVHPQASSTGATADETTPHHGTPRTTTTVIQRDRGPIAPPAWLCPVRGPAETLLDGGE
jgi:hypothetical protein